MKSAWESLRRRVPPMVDIEKSLFLQSIHALNKLNPSMAAEIAAHRFAKPRRWPEKKFEIEIAKSGRKTLFDCGLIGYTFGAGPIVLLVHGWGGRGLQLASFIKPIVDLGHQVVAIDGPAHGRSPGRTTSPTHFATFLKSLSLELHRIGILKSIVAHSFGAGSTILALESALNLERVVLIAPANNYGQLLDRYCLAIGIDGEAKKQFSELISYRVGIPAKQFFLADYFGKISKPTLVIHDRDDQELSFRESEALVKTNALAKLLLTQGLGHRQILRDQNVVKSVAEFVVG